MCYVLQDPAIVDGLACVTRDLEEVDDTYTLAQLTYALTLASRPLTDKVMGKLDTEAVHEGEKEMKMCYCTVHIKKKGNPYSKAHRSKVNSF